MKKFILLLFLLLPFISNSQTWADDSTIEDIIHNKSAFGDDESSIIIVEFWAKFNESNAFSDWNKLTNVQYFRVDIAKSPKAKKEYRVRMAPTIIIFKDGEEVARFQADLSFKMLATREEVQEEIDEQLMSDF